MNAKKLKNVSDHLALFFDAISNQYSLRTLKSFKTNEIVQTFMAKEYLTEPTYLSVQVSDTQHIHLKPEFLQYTNHSCEPNIFFDTEHGEIIALRDIAIGEEIRFFYPATEWKMAEAFRCFCHTESCLGTIQGANYLSPDSIKKYRFTKHIKEKLAQ
ncbi:hypothetical protein DOJK_00472 [Patescibacteria group bacterium]|nr:hypothetical protein DOJK_00472 [Patescibacteria group bacterium]